MADDDPLGRLAAEVARIRESIRGAFGKHATLAAEVAALTDKVNGIAPGKPVTPEAPFWMLEDAGQYQAQLTALKQWVSGVLLPEYGPYCEWLRDCWPAHRAAIWELSTLWAAWRLAYDQEHPDLQAAIVWHDRLLPGVVARLREPLRSCGAGRGCLAAANSRFDR